MLGRSVRSASHPSFGSLGGRRREFLALLTRGGADDSAFFSAEGRGLRELRSAFAAVATAVVDDLAASIDSGWSPDLYGHRRLFTLHSLVQAARFRVSRPRDDDPAPLEPILQGALGARTRRRMCEVISRESGMTYPRDSEVIDYAPYASDTLLVALPMLGTDPTAEEMELLISGLGDLRELVRRSDHELFQVVLASPAKTPSLVRRVLASTQSSRVREKLAADPVVLSEPSLIQEFLGSKNPRVVHRLLETAATQPFDELSVEGFLALVTKGVTMAPGAAADLVIAHREHLRSLGPQGIGRLLSLEDKVIRMLAFEALEHL